MLRSLTLVLCLLQLGSSAEPPGGYYTTRYDHLDVENILNQKRLVHYYAACLLDRGPCTPQGIEFKKILPEAIKTNCLRCTEKQRVVTLRSIRRLRKEYPDIWAQLQASWDPTGAYVKRLEGSVNKPIPIPTVSEANAVPLSNRFDDNRDDRKAQEITSTLKPVVKPSTTEIPLVRTSTESALVKPTTEPPTSKTTSAPTIPSTTLKLIISSMKPKPTTTFYTVTKRVVSPFSSIGPNLVVPNPKALIDKVISTAGAVLNSVTNKVTNTVITVFRG